MDDISWFTPQYTPGASHQKLLSEHNVCRAAADLPYIGVSVFTKYVINESVWTLDYNLLVQSKK